MRRFLDAAELPEERRPGPLVSLRDGVVFAAYNTYTSVEPLRKLAGANADTGYNPRVRGASAGLDPVLRRWDALRITCRGSGGCMLTARAAHAR